ncbi:hypothetical protein BJV82DRAFT_499043, partial [Fennellomyces sp. T-0311]
WNTCFPRGAHTVWWRALHRKISRRQYLYRFIPHIYSFPACIFCPAIDTQLHFLSGCHKKQEVWPTIAQRFLANPTALTPSHIEDSTIPPLPTLP